MLSTLHTNDAVSAFTRLIDMGVEPFLGRRCAVSRPSDWCRLRAHCANLASQPLLRPIWQRPGGHRAAVPGRQRAWREAWAAAGTGYRPGIYELVDLSSEMRDLIAELLEQMHRLAASQGQRNLREDGLIKAWYDQS